MKNYLLLLIFTLAPVAFAENRPRGCSAFNLIQDKIKCRVEKPNGSDEELCVYIKNKEEEELLLSIKNAWGKSVRHPLFVDAKVFEDELIVLLECQPPLSFFVRQRYKKIDGLWKLFAENAIQMMNTPKRQQLVTGKITARDTLVFYFLPNQNAAREQGLAGRAFAST